MSALTAKIEDVHFVNEWASPKGHSIFYHQVKLDNGDVFTCGITDKDDPKLKTGNMITYTVLPGQKLKVHDWEPESGKKPEPKKKSSSGSTAKGKYPVNPEDLLGYAFSYGKDIFIANPKLTETQLKKYIKNSLTIFEAIEESLMETRARHGRD